MIKIESKIKLIKKSLSLLYWGRSYFNIASSIKLKLIAFISFSQTTKQLLLKLCYILLYIIYMGRKSFRDMEKEGWLDTQYYIHTDVSVFTLEHYVAAFGDHVWPKWTVKWIIQVGYFRYRMTIISHFTCNRCR
jgi:hypothetical protein